MAKPIRVVPDDSFVSSVPASPGQLWSDHHEAVTEAVELLEWMHRRGVLQAMRAVMEQADSLLEIVVRQAETPGALGLIKNAIALLQGMSALDPKATAALLQGVARATQLARSESPVQVHGVVDLLRALGDPDVAQGLSVGLTVLKGLGAAAREAASGETSMGEPN
ncbi:MAG: DUF1641 domain-containing protein [Alicyclobacillus sp.]|nr:DUF1641 domain-containing protein [Alicyclobacillus sp.]